MALTKKQLNDQLSKLYEEMTYKQNQATDSVPEMYQELRDKIFTQYNNIRSKIQEVSALLMEAGGIE